jgi:hypothetical protein
MTDDRYKRGWEKLKAIIQISVYAGFPAALNGMVSAKEVLKKSRIVGINKKYKSPLKITNYLS